MTVNTTTTISIMTSVVEVDIVYIRTLVDVLLKTISTVDRGVGGRVDLGLEIQGTLNPGVPDG